MATIDDNITRARQRLAAAKRAKDPAGVQAAQSALNVLLSEQKRRAATPAPGPLPDRTARNSATAAVQAQLDAYGLGTLAPTVWQQWLDGVPIEQIVAGLRDTTEYKARFPGLDQMRREGRGITEQDWVNHEQAARSVMRAYGLPTSFYDEPSDFADLINKGVDVPELEKRVQAATSVVSGLPQSVRDAATAEGITLGDLTALWLDPDVAMPAIERKVRQLSVQGAATDAGWGPVGADTAAAYGDQGLDYGSAKQAFAQAQALTPLTAQQVGDTTTVDRGDLAAAVVGGNAQAKRKVQQKAAATAARSVQGGGFAGSGSGVSALGSASR